MSETRATHDLHYHYDGSVTPQVVTRVFGESADSSRAMTLVGAAAVRKPLEDPAPFFERFDKVRDVFELSGAVSPLVAAQFIQARDEGLKHLDFRFGCGALSSRLGLSEDAVLDGFKAAATSARNAGLDVCPTLCFSRHEPMSRAVYLAEFVCANLDFIRAVDLEGPEAPNPTREFGPIFRELRNAGLRITVHAGEFAPAEAIWEALDECGAERLGHAFSVTKDRTLMQRLARDQIPIEVCLTSNRLLGLCSDLKAHPFLQMLESGIPVVLCTDDRALFETSLSAEYEKAAVVLREIGQDSGPILDKIAENSRRFAFLESA